MRGLNRVLNNGLTIIACITQLHGKLRVNLGDAMLIIGERMIKRMQ